MDSISTNAQSNSPIYKQALVGLMVGAALGPLVGWFIGTFTSPFVGMTGEDFQNTLRIAALTEKLFCNLHVKRFSRLVHC